jgi:hypothetical protein
MVAHLQVGDASAQHLHSFAAPSWPKAGGVGRGTGPCAGASMSAGLAKLNSPAAGWEVWPGARLGC